MRYDYLYAAETLAEMDNLLQSTPAARDRRSRSMPGATFCGHTGLRRLALSAVSEVNP